MSARPITHDWKPVFLAALADVPSVMAAATAAGIGHCYAYQERKRDPEFAALWVAVREAKVYERRTCGQCGDEFRYPRSSGNAGRFCSAGCKFAAQREAGEASAVTAFWAKVEKSDRCWLWQASADENGYGMYRHTRAHRFSWELAHGPIPDGLFALHHCDNPPCVRPDHLFLGTLDDNMADRNAKGRQARGERAGRARLTAAAVLEARSLRSSGARVKDLAERFGVSEPTMGHACSGRTWSHL